MLKDIMKKLLLKLTWNGISKIGMLSMLFLVSCKKDNESYLLNTTWYIDYEIQNHVKKYTDKRNLVFIKFDNNRSFHYCYGWSQINYAKCREMRNDSDEIYLTENWSIKKDTLITPGNVFVILQINSDSLILRRRMLPLELGFNKEIEVWKRIIL
jgi:hypothetical protein